MSTTVKVVGAILATAVPLLVAVFAWWTTEQSRLRVEAYQRKEARYIALVSSLQGFYVVTQGTTQSKEAKARFIDQMNVCWLHCPDDLIRAGNTLLDSMSTGAASTASQRDEAARTFILAMRRDLMPATTLRPTDVRFFTPN